MKLHEKGIEGEIHWLFRIFAILKGLDGIVETVLGFLLLFTNVTLIVQALVQNELIEDPDNFFARHANSLVNFSPHAQFIGALYLLSHGTVKAFLSVALLREKMWAYPAGMAFFTVFVSYEFIRYIETRSTLLLAALAFDCFFLWLIWHEYRRRTKGVSAA